MYTTWLETVMEQLVPSLSLYVNLHIMGNSVHPVL